MSFKFKNILFIPLLILISCSKQEGCTDELACNFDSSAESDDGSCIMLGQIYGSGDVNGDNSIDVSDINFILLYILNQEYLGTLTCQADCNGDGNIDLFDIILIINQILDN